MTVTITAADYRAFRAVTETLHTGFDYVSSSLPLEVWAESHWPGFALRRADAFQSYTAWQYMQYVSITHRYIDNLR